VIPQSPELEQETLGKGWVMQWHFRACFLGASRKDQKTRSKEHQQGCINFKGGSKQSIKPVSRQRKGQLNFI